MVLPPVTVAMSCHLANNVHNAALCCGGPAGPLAMRRRKPRQARKGATVASVSCAGVWLVGSPPFKFGFPIDLVLVLFVDLFE